MAKISLRVNGKTQVVDAEPEMPLLYALRNDLATQRPQVRLRPGPVRRLHRDHGRQRDSFLRHSRQRGAE